MSSHVVAVAIAAGFSLVVLPAAQAQTAPREVGTLGGRSSWAQAINALGAVVGTSETPEGSFRAFIARRPGALAGLGPDDVPGVGLGINDLNDVVGSSDRAFARIGGRARELGPDPILADAQFVLAREHGFESWARLVHHIEATQNPELEQHRRIAEDLVRVYNAGDVDAAKRLNDLFHSELDVPQIHDFIRDRLFNVPDTERRIDNFTLLDAQLIVAQLHGFKDWDELVRSTSGPATDPHSAPFVLSSKPPFYRIDWANNTTYFKCFGKRRSQTREPRISGFAINWKRLTFWAVTSATAQSPRLPENRNYVASRPAET